MDIKDKILELVEEGIIDKDYLILALIKYLSVDEVEDMAHLNELLDRLTLYPPFGS